MVMFKQTAEARHSFSTSHNFTINSTTTYQQFQHASLAQALSNVWMLRLLLVRRPVIELHMYVHSSYRCFVREQKEQR